MQLERNGNKYTIKTRVDSSWIDVYKNKKLLALTMSSQEAFQVVYRDINMDYKEIALKTNTETQKCEFLTEDSFKKVEE